MCDHYHVTDNFSLSPPGKLLWQSSDDAILFSIHLVDILHIDLQDVDVGPEEVGGGEVEEVLVEDDVDAPAVPEVHHQAAVRDPLRQVVSEPSQAELTAKSGE